MKPFKVRFTPEAEDDLLRLYDFLLERDLTAADRALASINRALEVLGFSPFSCRKAGAGNPGFASGSTRATRVRDVR